MHSRAIGHSYQYMDVAGLRDPRSGLAECNGRVSEHSQACPVHPDLVVAIIVVYRHGEVPNRDPDGHSLP
jgi:hypothetical protein